MSTATSWTDLMGDALVLARKEGFDVFNALDLMENRYIVNQISICTYFLIVDHIFSVNSLRN